MKNCIQLLLILLLPATLWAQDDKQKLGDKEYIIVKDYKPVLGESLKISETPEGDTTTTNPPEMQYNIRSQKAATEYETSVIKAVKIKEEQLDKLYRSYVRLGIGNYTTYKGDLFVNALRSKKGALGLALNHHSGNPGLKDAGPAGFSKNHAGIYGKYFFENSTFTGDVNYDRNAVHYYGYNTNDTIINKNDLKQRFNNFGMSLGFGSNYLSRGNLDYYGTFGFSSLNDKYGVSENEFMVSAKGGKMVSDYYVNAELSFDYFRKTLADGELIAIDNDLSRNIITLTPTLNFNKDRANIVLGVEVSAEKNLDTDLHLFPKIDVSIPIVENIMNAFAGVNGGIIKNNYHTITEENPFVSSEIKPLNTINKLELKAGLNGNFSSLFSFVTMVKYTTMDRMMFYYNDAFYINKFDVIYINGKVLNLHAELSYNRSGKISAGLRFDSYSYSLDLNEEPWQRPGSVVVLDAKYNIWDKIIVNASVYAAGKYNVRVIQGLGYTSEKVKGYMDANLGLEYRYSKILSFYLNMNNLGFSRYYHWNNYPSELFNVLGGLTYSF